jgi:type III secretory pathway component EscR
MSSCEHDIELSGSITDGEFFDLLISCQRTKTVYAVALVIAIVVFVVMQHCHSHRLLTSQSVTRKITKLHRTVSLPQHCKTFLNDSDDSDLREFTNDKTNSKKKTRKEKKEKNIWAEGTLQNYLKHF